MEQQFYEQIKRFFQRPETKYTKLQTLRWWKHIGILGKVSWNSRAVRKRLSMESD